MYCQTDEGNGFGWFQMRGSVMRQVEHEPMLDVHKPTSERQLCARVKTGERKS